MSKQELFGVRVSASRTSKALCVITAGVAFVLGTVLGVLIPLYVLPPLSSTAEVRPGPQTVVQDYASARDNALETLTPRPSPVPPRAVMPSMDEVHVIDVSSVTPGVIESEETLSPPLSADEVRAEMEIEVVELEQFATTTTEKEMMTTTTTTTTTTTMATTASPAPSSSLTDGIFWNNAVEDSLPPGFNDEAVAAWHEFCQHSAFIKVEEGCGRMQNRLLTFENGTQSCCRYRQNFDQIQGEIFSFLLSRELGIRNLPPTSMLLVEPAEWQWSAVRAQLNLAQWAEQRPVVLTKFQEHLEQAYIPEPLRTTERRLHPTDLDLAGLKLREHRQQVHELAQWSDLIVFDYLTANLDRIVNNLYNQQWNPSMMDAPAHNLARDPATGLLIFLDNESGLLHGYRLLDKYETYHRTMLDALCVFRRQTVHKIRQLRDEGNIGELLRRMFRQRHPELLNFLPTLPEKSIKILNARIRNVADVMDRCERTYAS
ncbi:extracellular serine/threonine protein kinase four-jointed-like [Amphibalanus amphitrite]|uniref:extracellular serine/threonine protein kinase four-jointed-like n=1 Tax=Amphibalanus amphitrite TaxID=1232801 RepID=UPI001C926EEE|nr:extracellular serine/threonine protein kinase four-jointed-like [Amphibalanus amphitrite]